jgi:predicted dinucleotide-binding enzyme
MSYAIIGFGKIGQALAKAFARSGIEVSVATTRDPESFASAAAAIGPTIIPKHWRKPVKADIVFLAVRFESHPDVAKALPTWQGKTIVDVTNAYGVPPRNWEDSLLPRRRAGLHRRKTGQGLQPSGRCRPRTGSGRAWRQESRVPGERR